MTDLCLSIKLTKTATSANKCGGGGGGDVFGESRSFAEMFAGCPCVLCACACDLFV